MPKARIIAVTLCMPYECKILLCFLYISVLYLQTYPLKHKTRHTMEYTRQYLHLRSRTNAFGALLRIRHAATVGFHKFFTEEGFLNVQTPVLTSNDCEGAGDLFKVTVSVSACGNL